MAETLKGGNNGRLMAVVVANLAIFVGILKGIPLSGNDLSIVYNELLEILPATLAIALLTVANGLLSAEMKARLVFWRWKNPLPGCRAFSVHAQRDPRIDVSSLEHKLGKFPSDERQQNAVWYRLYKTVEAEPAVVQNHRDFLFGRDYTGLSALMLVVLSTLAIFQFSDRRQSLPYIALMTAQYLIVRYVAAGYGRRFVATVLAIKAAEE